MNFDQATEYVGQRLHVHPHQGPVESGVLTAVLPPSTKTNPTVRERQRGLVLKYGTFVTIVREDDVKEVTKA